MISKHYAYNTEEIVIHFFSKISEAYDSKVVNQIQLKYLTVNDNSQRVMNK